MNPELIAGYSSALYSNTSRTKWLLVALLSGGLALDYVTRLALASVYPLFRRDLHSPIIKSAW